MPLVVVFFVVIVVVFKWIGSIKINLGIWICAILSINQTYLISYLRSCILFLDFLSLQMEPLPAQLPRCTHASQSGFILLTLYIKLFSRIKTTSKMSQLCSFNVLSRVEQAIIFSYQAMLPGIIDSSIWVIKHLLCIQCFMGVLVTSNYYNRIPQTGGLNNKHLFLTVLEARSSRSWCQHALVVGEGSLPILQIATFSLYPLMAGREKECTTFLPLLIKTIILSWQLSWPNDFPKASPPNTIILGFGQMNFEGTQVCSP